MNREKLYHNTVNVLLDAYNNGTLLHGNCKSCAVGQICGNNAIWSDIFYTKQTILWNV